MVDESFSFGVLGKKGKGVTEHFNCRVEDVDILTGSLANAFAAGGGFCAGNTVSIDHQRLSGSGYCFSASMPAMISLSAATAIEITQADPSRLSRLQDNVKTFRKLIAGTPHVDIKGDELSPMIFVVLKKMFSDREEEEDLLQNVVNEALQAGALLTRSKYIIEEEMKPPKPNICVCVSESHTKEQLQKGATILKQSLAKFETVTKDY